VAPALYVDSGAGFSEAEVLRLKGSGGASAAGELALLPPSPRAIRFVPTSGADGFEFTELTITEVGFIQLMVRAVVSGPFRLHRVHRGLRYFWLSGWGPTKSRIVDFLRPNILSGGYRDWVVRHDTLSPADVAAIRAHVARLARRPTISVVMPVFNTPAPYLRAALESLVAQLYPDWQLFIADDASTAPHVAPILAEYAAGDPRIRVETRARNGHISAASNTALALAEGEFVALMDHDDVLPPHALYVVAAELAAYPDADILYSDEDKIDESGARYDPYFKTDWNPDLMRAQNLVSHLGVYRRSLVEDVGGFREGYEGSQDYDLALRASERTEPARIRHIPRILYHWRMFASAASFSTRSLPVAADAAQRALADHFARRGVAARVSPMPGAPRYSRVDYALPDPPPRVSAIVPTRDRVDLLERCIDGLLHGTRYPDLEVLIVDNGSKEPQTQRYFDGLARQKRVRILKFDGPFNFSAINNEAVDAASGDIVAFVNNDIAVIADDWLLRMVAHATRPEIGAVGAKLFYGDDTIQHAGVVTGLGGVAGHLGKYLPRYYPGYFDRFLLTHDVSVVTAACLVMRRALFLEAGGFDADNLAVAFNDVDLCLRLRERGYLNLMVPDAELYHLESASRGADMAPEKAARFNREDAYMHRRWGEILLRDPFYNPNLSLERTDCSLAFPPRTTPPWRDAALPTPPPIAASQAAPRS
jgi:GT2 family glycosyltransferase